MPGLIPILSDVERQLAAVRCWRPVCRNTSVRISTTTASSRTARCPASDIKRVGDPSNDCSRQRRKLRGLLQYPLILLGMLAMVVCGLIIFVYPELHSWQARPGSDRWQTLTINLGIYLLTCLLIVGGLHWYRWRRLSPCQQMIRRCHWLIVGRSYRLYYSYYLTSNLAGMLRHGLSLQEIIRVTNQYGKQSLLYQFSAIIRQLVAEGEQFDRVIVRYPFIPNELVVFINKGITLEELGDELTVFAQLQFKRLVCSIERLLVWVQPMIFVLIATVIVTLYLSILLPIYHSLQGVA
ncbi:MAG: type II secretion system F family protein [Limosilactobacillus pontis]